ncbi:hypothetical protein HYV49_01575 [Candidatus Pacearchaeota archaeon]|nr:hypothetical protein [Candidatus Pacearchaeota archaeon]
MHQKINIIPKTWAIKRKDRKFVVTSMHMRRQGIPLLIAMRDILCVVSDRRELGIALRDGKIKINNKIVKEDRFPLLLMYVLSFDSKHYRVLINDKGKFNFEEISEKDAKEITLKVIGKKILKKGKIQFNLSGGHNLIGNEEIKIGNSIVLDIDKNEVKKILRLEKGAHAIVIGGRHMGKFGSINHIEDKLAKIEGKNVHINVNLNNIMAIEK